MQEAPAAQAQLEFSAPNNKLLANQPDGFASDYAAAPLWERLRRCVREGKSGAGEGARTLDPDLGKVVLYH
jgi:hypothetical protein